VPKMTIRYEELLERIRAFGGLSVIAHPGLIHNEQIIYSLISAGIDGVEVFYPFHYSNFLVEKFTFLATQNGLLMTGGSDFHGNYERDYNSFGRNRIPVEVIDRLLLLAKQRMPVE